MKKILKYVENIWLGDDGKPSGKRVSALLLLLQLLYSALTNINAYTSLVKIAILKDTNISADKIAAAGAALSSFAMVFGAEACLIAALWGIAGYQTIRSKE